MHAPAFTNEFLIIEGWRIYKEYFHKAFPFIFLVSLWTVENGEQFFALDGLSNGSILLMAIPVLFFLSGVLTFYAVLKFKNIVFFIPNCDTTAVRVRILG